MEQVILFDSRSIRNNFRKPRRIIFILLKWYNNEVKVFLSVRKAQKYSYSTYNYCAPWAKTKE